MRSGTSTYSSDREPLEVRLDGMSLPLCEACPVVRSRDGVIRIGTSGLPGVVCDFVVVPYQLPGVCLVQELKIGVGAVGLVSSSVLVERPDLMVGLRDSVTEISVCVRRI